MCVWVQIKSSLRWSQNIVQPQKTPPFPWSAVGPKTKVPGERGGVVFYERALSDKLSGNAAHKIKKSGIPFFEHCSKLVFTRFPFVTKTSIYIEILWIAKLVGKREIERYIVSRKQFAKEKEFCLLCFICPHTSLCCSPSSSAAGNRTVEAWGLLLLHRTPQCVS